VEDALADPDADFDRLLRQSRLAVGDAEFCAMALRLHSDRAAACSRGEIRPSRRDLRALDPAVVLTAVCAEFGGEPADISVRRRNSILRPLAAAMLAKHAALTQKEIADLMGLTSSSAVSQQLRRIDPPSRTAAALLHRMDARLLLPAARR